MKRSNLKRVVALLLLVTLFNCECVNVYANEVSNESKMLTVEDISDVFLNYYTNSDNARGKSMSAEEKAAVFLDEYEQDIENIGYEPHVVHSENYEQEQELLNTDFSTMSIHKNGTYLILVGLNDGQENMSRSATSPSFTYNYNGTAYTLRTLTVTNADLNYGKSSYCDLLKTTSKTLIENCLNTAISVYLYSISDILGTVASICGLSVSDFSSSGETSLLLNCGSNWTRQFTQVYSANRGSWVSGSSVEYVKTSSYLSGHYYSARTNSMENVPDQKASNIFYSQNYSNYTWKCEQAIIYMLNVNGVNYDMTGDVKYSYGGKVMITHREDF